MNPQLEAAISAGEEVIRERHAKVKADQEASTKRWIEAIAKWYSTTIFEVIKRAVEIKQYSFAIGGTTRDFMLPKSSPGIFIPNTEANRDMTVKKLNAIEGLTVRYFSPTDEQEQQNLFHTVFTVSWQKPQVDGAEVGRE